MNISDSAFEKVSAAAAACRLRGVVIAGFVAFPAHQGISVGDRFAHDCLHRQRHLNTKDCLAISETNPRFGARDRTAKVLTMDAARQVAANIVKPDSGLADFASYMLSGDQ